MDASHLRSIEAVIFDFGGVFTDSTQIKAELGDYERRLGWPAGALLDLLGSGPAWEAVSIGAIREDVYWAQTGGRVAEWLPADFGRFQQGLLTFEALNPAMIEVATSVKERAKVGLLSNATCTLGPYLERLGWPLHIFDDMVISADVGLRKPDPRIFELAASRLGVAIDRCALIDDKERNVRAARAAGMSAIVFTSMRQLTAELNTLLMYVE